MIRRPPRSTPRPPRLPYTTLFRSGGTRFDTRPLHLGFMVNKVHCDRFPPSTLIFRCQYYSNSVLLLLFLCGQRWESILHLSDRGGTRFDTRPLHLGFMVNKGHCDRFSPSASVFSCQIFQIMLCSHYFYVADAESLFFIYLIAEALGSIPGLCIWDLWWTKYTVTGFLRVL
jgi:hypothetical protein